MGMAAKILSALYQIFFLFDVFMFLVNCSPLLPAGNIFTNATSIMMPDNETIIEMKIAVKNKDTSALTPVSKILLSPAVMDQIIGAVGQAIEVEDKKEGAAIRDSIRTAFIKMSGTENNGTLVKEDKITEEKKDDKNPNPKQKAKVTVRLTGNREPVVTLVENHK